MQGGGCSPGSPVPRVGCALGLRPREGFWGQEKGLWTVRGTRNTWSWVTASAGLFLRLGRAQPAGRTLAKSCPSPVRAVSQPTQGLYEAPLAIRREPVWGLMGLPTGDSGNGEVQGRGYAAPAPPPSCTPLRSCVVAVHLQDGSCTGLLGLHINTSSSSPATLHTSSARIVPQQVRGS